MSKTLLSTLLFTFHAQLGTAEEDVYNIHFDGVHPSPIPREDVSGPTSEIFYRYRDASSQGIRKVNATHVYIPFYSMLQADYTRDFHVVEKTDSGISKQIWGENPVSSIGRNVIIGSAEKMHIQVHEGEWSTEGAELVDAARETYDWRLDRKAENEIGERTRKEMAYLTKSGMGRMLVKAAQDENHLDEVEAFAVQGDPQETWANTERLHEQLDDAAPDASKEVLRTDNNCWHLEATPGLGHLPDHSGMYVPVNTHIVSARGQVSYAPDPTFSVPMGVTMFKFDEENDVLYSYVLASSILYLPHLIPLGTQGIEPKPVTGKLYVGPADGANWPMAAGFGRSEPPAPDASLKDLYDELKSMPYDFDTWQRDPRVACPNVKYRILDRNHKRIDLHFISEPKDTWRPFEWMKAMAFVPFTTESIDCTVDYMRPPPQYRSSVANNFLPLVTLGHGLAEIGPSKRMEVLAGREWDNLKCFGEDCPEPESEDIGFFGSLSDTLSGFFGWGIGNSP